MDRQTALLVLQLTESPTPEEIQDAFETHVFDLRDFLFRQTVIPQVFRAKVDRMLVASEIGETLGIELPCLDGSVPEMEGLEGPADQVVRIHQENVSRLRTAMAATLDPTCLTRLGECLVRMQQQYILWMTQWSAERILDEVHPRPMRDEWSPHDLAAALERERKGLPLEDEQSNRLAEELLRLRTLGGATLVV